MESPSDGNMMREPLLGSSSKGGFRTLPFVIANEAFEKVASYGLLPNMVVYLMGGYGMELVTASNYIFYWSAATNLAPVIGAFLADSYVGQFRMIGFGSIISFLGTLVLWLTTMIPGAKPCDESGSECTSMNIFQLALLISSFGLMSIGAGGIRSSSLAFGANQLENKASLGNSGILEKFINWYYVAASAAAVAALTIVVYIQENIGWRVGFGVPVVLMFLSAISFFLASSSYIKLKGKASSLVGFAQVLVASWKKRDLNSSFDRTDQLYHVRKGSKLTMPSNKLRFLNKACIVRNAKEEIAPNGTALDPWSLCTTDQVEELKALVKVIPMWSTGIMISVTFSQVTFMVLQSGSMDRHITSNFEIPAGSFGTFMIISLIVWIALYDRVIIPLATRIMGKQAHLSVRKRMGIGLLLSSLSMVAMAIVEGIRREIAIREGLSDYPNAVVPMSAFWLMPHYFIAGVAQAFNAIGQNEFFYTEFPRTMSSVATNLYGLGMFVANLVASLIVSSIDTLTSKGGNESWVSSNINKGHLDYYFWILAGLCFVNFFYYLLCDRAYGPSADQERALGVDQELTYES